MNDIKKIYKKGNFLVRFGAYVIDAIILSVLSFAFVLLLPSFHLLGELIGFWLPPLYGSLFLWQKDATPGKMLFHIKVVNEFYKPIGFGTALLRETIGKFISAIVFSLGFLWMLLDKKNQTWHDKIAHTFVVRTNKTGTLIPTTSNEKITVLRITSFCLLFFVSFFPTIFLVTYIFFFRPFQMSGDAMLPNFKNGEYVVTQITQGPLKRGDVIIFKAPPDPNKDFIKRVIGLPGDTVMLENGSVYVNNQPLDESKYLNATVQTYGGDYIQDYQQVTVPANSYFVLGDNRPFSNDSRVWGVVPQKDVISKILFCYWNCTLK